MRAAVLVLALLGVFASGATRDAYAATESYVRSDASGAGWWQRRLNAAPRLRSVLDEQFRFGRSVAVTPDGQFVAVGAPGHGGTGAGQVRVFRFDPSAGWVQVGGDIDDATGSGLGLGAAVAISDDGTRVVAGAPRDRGDLLSVGYVHVYDLVGGAWTAVGGPITDFALFSQIGDAVAISGDGTTVAGGNHTDSEGSVQVYRLGGTQ